MKHFGSSLPDSAVGNVMHMSALTTLSCRIGQLHSHTAPHKHRSQGSSQGSTFQELTKLWTLWSKELKRGATPPKGGVANEDLVGESTVRKCEEVGRPEAHMNQRSDGFRWKTVGDVKDWLVCPVGVCPGQEVTANMFDLPLPPNAGGHADNGPHGDGSDVECVNLQGEVGQ